MSCFLESVKYTHIDNLFLLRCYWYINSEIMLSLFFDWRWLNLIDLFDIDVKPSKVGLELASSHILKPAIKVLPRKLDLHLFIDLLKKIRHWRFLTELFIDRINLLMLDFLHYLTHSHWLYIIARSLCKIYLFLFWLGYRLERKNGLWKKYLLNLILLFDEVSIISRRSPYEGWLPLKS